MKHYTSPGVAGRLRLAVLFVLVACAGTVVAQQRSPCAGNQSCPAPQQCQPYSSRTYVDCNALGRLFGCTTASGGCALFCSTEIARTLRCVPSCSTNAQCRGDERCTGTEASGRFCRAGS